jgi:hypothetical protein
MRTLSRQVILIVAITQVIALAATAGTYTSWKGGFRVDYPDHFEQVDYATADAYLRAHRAGRTVLDYEAVFADTAAHPFAAGQYFIVTVDTLAEMSERVIDSTLGELRRTFGEDIKYFPVADLTANLKSAAPSYDAKKRMASVISNITQGDEILKKSLLLTKFYDGGIASFYFYSPVESFKEGIDVMQEVVASFSTENLGRAEPVKVAEVDTSLEEPGGGNGAFSLILPIGAVVIVIVVLVVILKRKK